MNTDNRSFDRDKGLRWLQQMIRIRRFEEQCAELYRREKIRGFLHLYIGEEAIAVGVMDELQASDAVVATYREHGHALARGISMNAILAEMYGKQQGCCRGRGGSMHLFDAETRFYGGNAIVGGGLPMAVGLALADKLQNRKQLSVCFFGEGAAAEGEFHESLNLATLWKLPVLFLCENNLYAMGTALARSESQTDIHVKAQSYGLHAEAVDGMDIVAVNRATRQCLESIRSGNGPALLEMRTYRFRAHSMFDPELYRSKEEVAEWQQRCPIALFTQLMRDQFALSDSELKDIEAQVQTEIDAAIAFAEAGEWEAVEELQRDVYTAAEATP